MLLVVIFLVSLFSKANWAKVYPFCSDWTIDPATCSSLLAIPVFATDGNLAKFEENNLYHLSFAPKEYNSTDYQYIQTIFQYHQEDCLNYTTSAVFVFQCGNYSLYVRNGEYSKMPHCLASSAGQVDKPRFEITSAFYKDEEMLLLISCERDYPNITILFTCYKDLGDVAKILNDSRNILNEIGLVVYELFPVNVQNWKKRFIDSLGNFDVCDDCSSDWTKSTVLDQSESFQFLYVLIPIVLIIVCVCMLLASNGSRVSPHL